jgi:signal peptidase II
MQNDPGPAASIDTPPVAPPPPAPAPFSIVQDPPPDQRASVAFLTVVTVLSLAADLVTKAWAKGRLSGAGFHAHGRKPLVVWKDHFEFIFAQNPGGAWSFLRGLPDTLRRPFFLVVSAAAIVFIVSIYRRVHRDQTAMKWGLPLALGGAMGNLVDRIRYGWVIDFIDFQHKGHHWPTFNVADIAIVVGVGLMGIDMLRHRRAHPGESGQTPATVPPAA